MVAPRRARQIIGFRYEEVINAIDWNRILIQARAEHIKAIRKNSKSHSDDRDTCGTCIRSILLRKEEI